jgi:hypothetical protein
VNRHVLPGHPRGCRCATCWQPAVSYAPAQFVQTWA